MADPDQDKPEEIEARMAAALKRALSTPPRPHKTQADVQSSGAEQAAPRRAD